MTLDLAKTLACRAEASDRSLDWPFESLNAVQESGGLAWSIPKEWGGMEWSPAERMAGHEHLASGCLTTAFILSQREACVRQLLKGPRSLQERILPDLLAGAYGTVGLSQLTTSRQHLGPSLLATATHGGYQLDGSIPWVTGADQSLVIIAGATLGDGRQVLVALPPDRAGITIAAPLPLSSLVGSRTAEVRLNAVEVERELVVAGPTEQVMGQVGGGGLETTNLALGLSVAAIDLLQASACHRPELMPIVETFCRAADSIRQQLHELVLASDAESVMAVRVAGTKLALKTTQTALLFLKGAGFVAPHPAQRLARQALFFLVWSCPRPVASGVLDDMLMGMP
ncbi:MAG: acyl-CoA/acyl-ACP dehydrogenase [Planctomycetaceae bacterium]|nr:acyl-CoA/acyl-ACP dehydrogenase [Planctomycetaceae bacterium]